MLGLVSQIYWESVFMSLIISSAVVIVFKIATDFIINLRFYLVYEDVTDFIITNYSGEIIEEIAIRVGDKINIEVEDTQGEK